MSLGNINMPQSGGPPIGFSPFSALPSSAAFNALLQAGGFARFNFDFNQASIVALGTGPLPAVPAPGAGKIWMPMYATSRLTRDTVAWTSSPALRLQFTGSVVSRVNAFTILLANGPGATLDQLVWTTGLATKTDANNVTGENLALEWQFASTPTPNASVGTRLRLGLVCALVQLY